MKAVLSCDVEDWFQVENLRSAFPPASWDAQERRVAESTRTVLSVLTSEGVTHATFFVLGWVAKRHPKLVRAIVDAGYELASHGMDHRSNFELSPDERLANLRDSKALLEDLSGRPVVGYRAPSFTVDEDLIDAIAATGYRYDSSFNPFGLHDRYGHLDLSRYETNGSGGFRRADGLIEFPVATRRLMGREWPFGGGGYFRLYPSAVFHAGVRAILRERGLYVFYFHPWELDPAQPRVTGIGRFNAFRHYVNLDRTAERLRGLIQMLKREGVEMTSFSEIVAS